MAKATVSREQKIEEARLFAEKLTTVSSILDRIEQDMKWNAMDYHSADEEHGDEPWYTEPNEGSYNYSRYLAYREVIELIEKKYF